VFVGKRREQKGRWAGGPLGGSVVWGKKFGVVDADVRRDNQEGAPINFILLF
jgi:hypothetical protein